ncbi:hypothetical protein ES702_01106 [subsurface metagenome]
MHKTAFMVMPFDDCIAESIYSYSTKPICEEFDLTMRRADEIFSANPMLDDITIAIEQAAVIIVDISGKNPNVFYELGMSHMLKRKSTIMITHDKYSDVPFDIAHFRIIGYQNTIKGKAKYEHQLKLTLKTVLTDLKELYKDEFDVVIEILAHTNKESLLYYILGLSKSQIPIRTEAQLGVEGHNDVSGSHSKGSSLSAVSALRPFLAKRYIEVVGNTISLTDKGRAFCEYLEDKGYVVDRLDKQTFTKGYVPFFERMAQKKHREEAESQNNARENNSDDS